MEVGRHNKGAHLCLPRLLPVLRPLALGPIRSGLLGQALHLVARDLG